MSGFNEDYSSRILELLNIPMFESCSELTMLFDRSSLRELQDIFPTFINAIFGVNGNGLGWGLRTVSKENFPILFNCLYNFFIPFGPMFRLCYRLLNDAIKFEFSTELLPNNLTEMLHSGHYSIFYTDLLNVDPFHRCITSLSLNAFDYFILNFIIHGTFPLHKIDPDALLVHNDRIKTVYFYLTADYLCSFLPSSPNTVVIPTNICGTVKPSQPLPVQPLKPTRSPKYLKLSPLSHYQGGNQTTGGNVIRQPESPRTNTWRTESVMYLFIDVWLRYDIDDTMELPSSEFIRVVRILVKQLHAFGNAADLDHSSLCCLRKIAQPMMKVRIYPFLRTIMARWPLDCSMLVVLELWLSYIQPWRYTCEMSLNNSDIPMEIPINNKFEAFISENLVIYTQIFVQILSRFERLDFTSYRNVTMLFRLIKVFSQSTLPEMLCECELRYTNSNYSRNTPHHVTPNNHSPYNIGQQDEITNEWESFRTDGYVLDENYIPMYGYAMKGEVQQLIKTVSVAKMYIMQEIQLHDERIAIKNRGLNFIKRRILQLFEEITPEELKFNEKRKIPEILDLSVQSLSKLFEIDLPNFQIDRNQSKEISAPNADYSIGGNGDYLELSKLSPMQMRNKLSKFKPTIDPALQPIQSHECKFLVRFLHQVSGKLNEMFSAEILNFWNRTDIWGRFSRQLLYEPIIIQWFDKSRGVCELREDHLPPRVCLRILASFKTLFLIFLSILFGQLLWGVPSFGLFLLTICIFLYLLLLSYLS